MGVGFAGLLAEGHGAEADVRDVQRTGAEGAKDWGHVGRSRVKADDTGNNTDCVHNDLAMEYSYGIDFRRIVPA